MITLKELSEKFTAQTSPEIVDAIVNETPMLRDLGEACRRQAVAEWVDWLQGWRKHWA